MDADAPRDLDPAFFARMVESVGVGVGIYDQDGEYVYVNEAYADLFGVEPDALVGTPIWDVVPEFEGDRFDEYWASFEPDGTHRAETVHEFAGTRVPVATVTTCHAIDGTPYHFGTITDISERKAREEEIKRQNERLENFASIVSHDLRNPLNVAQGYIEMLQADVDRDELRLVDNALDRMDSLISELLSLAQSGEQVGAAEPVSIRAVAEAAWDSVATPGATLQLPEADREVVADRSRLQELFENLFRNAVEHNSGPGSPTDEGGGDPDGDGVTVTVGLTDDGFYVADDGRGIPPEDRETVFSTGYTTADDGTGLGLSIVTQIASGHGWNVAVTESAEGGARFEVTGTS